MTELMYRGVAYSANDKPKQTYADQIRKPELVYRGVEHDGERPTENTKVNYVHIYRGVRYA